MTERIVKLTKRTVDAARPEAERYILWDSSLKGFGMRVETSGTKTFLVRYRTAARKRFVAVGRFGQLTPEQARGLAQEALASVRRGHDPADERRKERVALSVAALAARFFAEHVNAKRKSSTAVHYRSLIDSRAAISRGCICRFRTGPIRRIACWRSSPACILSASGMGLFPRATIPPPVLNDFQRPVANGS